MTDAGIGYVGNTQEGSSDGSLIHAALFDSGTGKVTNLNDLIPHASGGVLTDAAGINDSGQIIGGGTFNGVAEGFLLTPSTSDVAAVPEPGTLAIAAVGIVAVALRRRAKRKHEPRCEDLPTVR